MNPSTEKWLMYGAIVGVGIAIYYYYQDYTNNQKVQALKTSSLTAAGTPPVVTPPSVPVTASFVQQPGDLGFVNQPTDLGFVNQPMFE